VSVVDSRSMAEPAAPSQASLLALSSLNFFPSDMQTAFGPIAAAYLALQGWTAKDIRFVLAIGSTASSQSDPRRRARGYRTAETTAGRDHAAVELRKSS
jgi:hypothetical protein